MGYHSTIRGCIKFSPGLTINEVRRHKVLRKFESGSGECPDIEFRTYGGELIDSIEAGYDGAFKAYDIVEELETIVAELPNRTFSGRLEIYGEETGDVWGLKVKDGTVVQVEPKLVWPED